MRASALLNKGFGVNVVAGVTVVIILTAMLCSWLLRGLLLRMLRSRHPRAFAELGHPDNRQLTSFSPRHRELQIRFWKYLWNGEVFRVKDKLVSSLAWAALIADVALGAGLVVLLWVAGT